MFLVLIINLHTPGVDRSCFFWPQPQPKPQIEKLRPLAEGRSRSRRYQKSFKKSQKLSKIMWGINLYINLAKYTFFSIKQTGLALYLHLKSSIGQGQRKKYQMCIQLKLLVCYEKQLQLMKVRSIKNLKFLKDFFSKGFKDNLLQLLQIINEVKHTNVTIVLHILYLFKKLENER